MLLFDPCFDLCHITRLILTGLKNIKQEHSRLVISREGYSEPGWDTWLGMRINTTRGSLDSFLVHFIFNPWLYLNPNRTGGVSSNPDHKNLLSALRCF